MKYRTSPERYSFHQNCDKKNLESGIIIQEVYEMYQKLWQKEKEQDATPTTNLPDLEYELRTSDYIYSKCVESVQYCKNLYAALCNNEFTKDNHTCSYSWRNSGGIISNILETGDYIDWYLSGNEGYITEEIKKDLESMGWEIKSL